MNHTTHAIKFKKYEDNSSDPKKTKKVVKLKRKRVNVCEEINAKLIKNSCKILLSLLLLTIILLSLLLFLGIV
jgi:uncharacterized membrane protein (DUF106 family)